MRVTLVSTNDCMGGAARCSFRIWEALRRAGSEAVLLCLRRSRARPGVACAADGFGPDLADALEETWTGLRDRWRGLATDRCVSMVTPPGPGVDIAALPAIAGADVINLHWITWFLGPADIAALGRLGKPLVWTLHDESAFTGGCHYAADCDGFTRDCAGCPQVSPEARPTVARALADRQAALGGVPLTVVTTSRWLAGRARASSLFRGTRIEVVPSGLDTGVFRPDASRAAAKRHLGLSPRDRVVLMPASTLHDVRKGARLADAYLACLAREAAQAPAWGGRLRVVFFGATDRDLSALPVPAGAIAERHEEEALARVYAAGDCLVTLSGHDNLPNVVHEAMSCGTPVAAFDVGGVPEMIEPGRQGVLARAGDVPALANLTARLLADPEGASRMGAAGRQAAVKEYALSVAADRYLRLFQELVDHGRTFAPVVGKKAHPTAFPPGAGDRVKARRGREQAVSRGIARAFALRDAGRHDAALAKVDGLLGAMPGDLELSLVRGGLLVASGQAGQAVGWLSELYARHPDNRVGLARCDALRLAGDAAGALAVVENLAARNPLAPGLHKKRGQAVQAMGGSRQALRHYFTEYRMYRDAHALELARGILRARRQEQGGMDNKQTQGA